MEGMYYIGSDGSLIDMESFISYVLDLERMNEHFVFIEWFCEDDFSDIEIYNYLENLF
ncbi:hypothetical protein [Pedobacter sp. BS3]|uniref:hypothetical protein n=1 Tax=Pedobacter sp. BS3 TaxID=2567937 RepID=UPI0016590CD9|nr:hypothetical protein [Pedobacter sp. BS3]